MKTNLEILTTSPLDAFALDFEPMTQGGDPEAIRPVSADTSDYLGQLAGYGAMAA